MELIFSMSSFLQKETQTSEPLPCPECGLMQMVGVVENCRLQDGFTVRRLRHFKCRACDAHFFDDSAMNRIQEERNKQRLPRAV
jgi:hypothetical protein